MRLIQLSLGVIAGFGSIYFGYRLFMQATKPSKVANSGRFKIPGFGEINLRAAPGIFFAVIGAIIVYVSLSQPVKLSLGPPPGNATNEASSGH
jgi:hypothetical protein